MKEADRYNMPYLSQCRSEIDYGKSLNDKFDNVIKF